MFLNPAVPRIIVFSWRIRAYDFQRVIRPSLALLRCPVVGCSAPLLSFMQGGWDGQEKTAPSSLLSFLAPLPALRLRYRPVTLSAWRQHVWARSYVPGLPLGRRSDGAQSGSGRVSVLSCGAVACLAALLVFTCSPWKLTLVSSQPLIGQKLGFRAKP